MLPWRLAHGTLLDCSRPLLAGIINVTPDSFADGGRHLDASAARDAALRMIEAGATLLDLGAESTRPGATRVDGATQVARLLPVIRAIRAAAPGVPLCVDTTLASVARIALDEGVGAVNDVSGGLEDPAMASLVAATGAGMIVMHRLTTPERDSYSDCYDRPPEYGDVESHVTNAFAMNLLPSLARAGVGVEQVVVDPGLGFGKSVEDNLRLIDAAGRMAATLGRPVMSGLSRKSFVGRVSLGRDSTPSERLEGTLALSVLHLLRGARIFRVHDVEPHARAIHAAWAAMQATADVPGATRRG
ncbi:MAG: dihydropteroate synthase [Phycisphaerae bacterium]|jgi:dihydropteroate synthase